jgi:hypothetical protein
MSRPVLAGVVDAGGGLPTVDVAAAEAVARTLPLRLVDLSPTSAGAAPPARRSAEPGRLVEDARRRVSATYPDLPVSTATAAGDDAAALLDEARRAELVVVGNSRHPRLAGVVAVVAARAACPVIVVPAGAGSGSRRLTERPVVVGIKGSDGDSAAVRFGLAEAALRGVALRAVHVWLNIPDMELASVDPFVYDLAEAGRDADRLIRAALRGWVDRYPQVRVERTPLYRTDVADTLIGACADAGLLVLGQPRHSQLGPVGRALTDSARCPVGIAR